MIRILVGFAIAALGGLLTGAVLLAVLHLQVRVVRAERRRVARQQSTATGSYRPEVSGA